VPDQPLIAVIHSTTASMPPTTAAFAAEYPAARVWNLLDDRLACDADAAGHVTTPLRNRMVNLIGHGVDGGAAAVLMACSMYGSAQAFAANLWSTPVFTSDGDMMDALAAVRPQRVAVLASLKASAVDSHARLAAHLNGSGVSCEVVGVFCEDAAGAASVGDHGGLVKALADGMRSLEGPFDALCIAQYSLSPAHDELADLTGISVFSPPRAAAAAIRSRLGAS
jgi:hypothetical protein